MNWHFKIEALLRPNPLAAFSVDDDVLSRLQSAFPMQLEVDNRVANCYQQSLGLELLVANEPFDYSAGRSNLLVRHPLSGAKREFPLPRTLTDEDVQALHQRFNQAVASLREHVCGSQGPQTEEQARSLYFTLWRLLPQRIRDIEANCKEGDVCLGELWDILPADPRMPATTIWQQAALTSALAGAGDHPSLAVVDVAGIQAFLGVARRTQDFWAGSYLASYLIWRAIANTIQQFGPDCFLFPSLQDSPIVDHWLVQEARFIDKRLLSAPENKDPRLAIGSFPERLTVILPKCEAEQACRTIKDTLCSTWRTIADQVKAGVELSSQSFLPNWSPTLDELWESRWAEDIESVWSNSVSWVVVPWPDTADDVTQLQAECKELDPAYDSDLDDQVRNTIIAAGHQPTVATNYSIVSRYAGRSLQSRKMHRGFVQSKAPHGFHCSLSGTHLAVLPSSDMPHAVLTEYWTKLSSVAGSRAHGRRVPKMQGRIRSNEQLSCVTLVKRLALQEYFDHHLGLIDRHIFPSTAGVATARFKASILEAYQQGHLRDELGCYLKAIEDLLSDDDLFYPANPLPRLVDKAEELELADDPIINDPVRKKGFLYLDGDWLYPESLDPARLEKEYGRSFDESKVKGALAALNRFLQAAKRLKGIEPGRKIAIVSMDGDKLGEWIAGGRAPAFLDAFTPNVQANRPTHWLATFDDAKQPLTLARHLAISEMLRVFSQKLVPLIVEEQVLIVEEQVFGKVIYSGGDDVLAVVAVEDLLKLCNLLRLAFVGLDHKLNDDQCLKNGYFEDKSKSAKRICPLGGLVEPVQAARPMFYFDDELNSRQAMTCSIGAVVVHERSPLSHAISVCFNEALKHGAKDTRGRNAFEIHLQQRSGSVLVCGGRWALPIGMEQPSGTVTEQESTVELLDQLRGHFAAGRLSSRLVSDMSRYALGFSGSALVTDWLDAGKSALKSMVASHAGKAHRPTVYAAICGLLELQHQQRVEEAQASRTEADEEQQLTTDDSWQQVCDLLKAIQSL